MTALILIIVVLVIIGLPIYLFIKGASKRVAKQKASSWEGKLVDKEHIEYEDDDESYTKDVYSLYFETNEGEKVKINVTKDIFDKWEKQDKAKKITGEKYPKKI